MLRVLLICVFFNFCVGIKYVAYPSDEKKLFAPCPGEEDHFITKYVNLDNLTLDRVNDDIVNISGTFIWKAKISPLTPLVGNYEVYESKQGTWVSTIFNGFRENFCEHLFLQTESWYKFTEKFEGDARECPPKPGTVYTVNDVASASVNLTRRDFEGNYKVRFRLANKNFNMCFFIFGYAYKA